MARVKWVVGDKPAPTTSPTPSSPPDAPLVESSPTAPVNESSSPAPVDESKPTVPAVESTPPTPRSLRRSIRQIEKSSANDHVSDSRWDDWVPQDRLRKLTEDNRELAASLRREVMQSESRQRNSKSTGSSKKGRTQGSEIGSGRGSEERHSSVPAGGRGTKRGKDNEIEKVATPDFPTPPRISRMQSTGSSNFPISRYASAETEPTPPPPDVGLALFQAAQSVEAGPSQIQDARRGKAGSSNRGVRTMALRTIHGTYDEDEEFVPNSEPEVMSIRGFFNGSFTSANSSGATKRASHPATRRSRRAEKENEQEDQTSTSPPGPNCTEEEMTEFVMEVLNKLPPPDEPEHMTTNTFNNGHHWAPLIGGTTESERAQIEEKARQTGVFEPKQRVHPQYEKTRINDPLNAARLHFFEGQGPDRKLMIAGVPKDPTHIDPPGSGTCFDALGFPDRLIQLPTEVLGNLTTTDLQKLDRATIMRFPKSALRILPPKALNKLKIPIPSAEEAETDSETLFQEEAFFARPSVHFSIPDIIKGYLVDDWENVTKNLTLVDLPSRAPVNWILDTYFHEEKGKRRLGSEEADRFIEIVGGVKEYFEGMLGKTLLYKFERGQYANVCTIPRHPLTPFVPPPQAFVSFYSTLTIPFQHTTASQALGVRRRWLGRQELWRLLRRRALVSPDWYV